MLDLGTVKPGATIRIPFSTFDKDDGSSITMTNFAVGDILVYKDGSTTERASTAGFTATTDFDAKTGKHLIVIDLADNTTAGFFAAGSEYHVALDSVTVDTVTTGGWLARFRIGYQGALLDTTIATLSSQTSFTLTAGPAEDDALNGLYCILHDVASAVQCGLGLIADYTGSTKTITLAAGTTFTVAAGDNISIMGLAPLQPATLGRKPVVDAAGLIDANTVKLGPSGTGTAQTARDIGASVLLSNGTGTGQIVLSSGKVVTPDDQKVDLHTIKTQAVTCAAGVTVLASVGTAATSTAQTGDTYARLGAPAGASVSADVAAVKAQTAAIETDTQDIQNRVPSSAAATNMTLVFATDFNANYSTSLAKWRGDLAAIAGDEDAADGLKALALDAFNSIFYSSIVSAFGTGSSLTSLAPASTALSTAQWTNARAGYLDNINVGGAVASSAQVTGLNVNTRCNLNVPIEIETPDSSTQVYKIRLHLYDLVGNMEAPDSTPTVTLTNAAGTDRSSRLSAASNPSTGVYTWDYTATAGDAEEQLVWIFSVVEASVTRTYPATSYVVEQSAYRFSSTDRSKLDAIHAKLPSKSYLTGTANSDGDVEMSDATGNFPGSVASVVGNVGGNVSGNVSGSVGSVTTVTSITSGIGNMTMASFTTNGTLGRFINDLVSRLGAFTGTGDNTVLGFLRTLARADFAAPSDLGGTYTASIQSLEAQYSALAGITAALAGLNDLDATAVQAAAAAALAAYDPPTNAEMVARTLVAADYATATNLAAVKAKTDNLPSDPADASVIAAAFAALNDLDATEVQAAANAALVANHLDHLLAADYDPASKPGVATALLNELIENDGGVSRFTANALEQAPSGGGGGGSAPTAIENADALLDRVDAIETGLTLRKWLRAEAAVLAGKVVSSGGGVFQFRNAVADDAVRVTVTIVDGVRSTVTYNL